MPGGAAELWKSCENTFKKRFVAYSSVVTVVVLTSASQSVDIASIPCSCDIKDFSKCYLQISRFSLPIGNVKLSSLSRDYKKCK